MIISTENWIGGVFSNFNKVFFFFFIDFALVHWEKACIHLWIFQKYYAISKNCIYKTCASFSTNPMIISKGKYSDQDHSLVPTLKTFTARKHHTMSMEYNHPDFLCNPIVNRKFHSDRIFLITATFWNKPLQDALVRTTILTTSSQSYPHNLQILLPPLIFILHTSLCYPLP